MKAISLLFVVMMTLLAGCNTVDGFGKDVSKLGDKIQQSGK